MWGTHGLETVDKKNSRRTGHPQLWWLLQFEGRATRPQQRGEGLNVV